MRTTRPTPPVTVSIIAMNMQTGRLERLVHVGRVNSPATARDMLALIAKATKEGKTRIAF